MNLCQDKKFFQGSFFPPFPLIHLFVFFWVCPPKCKSGEAYEDSLELLRKNTLCQTWFLSLFSTHSVYLLSSSINPLHSFPLHYLGIAFFLRCAPLYFWNTSAYSALCLFWDFVIKEDWKTFHLLSSFSLAYRVQSLIRNTFGNSPHMTASYFFLPLGNAFLFYCFVAVFFLPLRPPTLISLYSAAAVFIQPNIPEIVYSHFDITSSHIFDFSVFVNLFFLFFSSAFPVYQSLSEWAIHLLIFDILLHITRHFLPSFFSSFRRLFPFAFSPHYSSGERASSLLQCLIFTYYCTHRERFVQPSPYRSP